MNVSDNYVTSRENRIKKKMDRGEKGREGKREGEGNRDKKGVAEKLEVKDERRKRTFD